MNKTIARKLLVENGTPLDRRGKGLWTVISYGDELVETESYENIPTANMAAHVSDTVTGQNGSGQNGTDKMVASFE